MVCKDKKYVVKVSSIEGTGVYALKDIKKDSRIIPYVGEKISKSEGEKRSNAGEKIYIFELDKKWDIDGDVLYNDARYINHSCNPNCITEIDEEAGEIWIVALKDIAVGEELCYDYNFECDDDMDVCRCGSTLCRGFIVGEKFWKKAKKKAKVC